MLNDFTGADKVYVACGHTDLRKGIDGLEQGAYQWPRSKSEVKTLTPQQYRWLMEGLKIEQPKAHRPVKQIAVKAHERKRQSGNVLDVVPAGTRTEVVEYRLPENELIYSACVGRLVEIGKEVRRTLDYMRLRFTLTLRLRKKKESDHNRSLSFETCCFRLQVLEVSCHHRGDLRALSIEAIQVRLDKVYNQKFYNLTSIDQYYGTQSKCCPHYVWVHESDEVVCLTEGVMKADIAYNFAPGTSYESGFVGLTGVPSYSQFERALEELNSIGVVRINIMVDSDYQVKEEVRKARDRYIEMGVAAGFEVAPIMPMQYTVYL